MEEVEILKEIEAIKKKYYIDDSSIVEVGALPPFSFRLLYIPSSEDFPYAFSLVDDDEIPERIGRRVEEAVKTRAQIYTGRRMLKGLLTYLDNNLESLLVDKEITEVYSENSAVRVVSAGNRGSANARAAKGSDEVSKDFSKDFSNMRVLKKDGEEDLISSVMKSSPHRQKSKKKRGRLDGGVSGSNGGGTRGPKRGEEVKIPLEEKEEVPHGATEPKGETISISGMKFKLSLEEFESKNTGTLELKTISVALNCKRCGIGSEKILKPGTNVLSCPRCSHSIYIVLKAFHVHSQATVFAEVIFANSTFVDILNTRFSTYCLECAETIPCHSLPGIFETNCRACFTRIMVKYSSISTELESGVAKAEVEGSKPKKAQKKVDFLLHAGKELTAQGTCKHYENSHRWFRFPCCRRSFPCDICHDDTVDHKTTDLANSMICGFCSREQPVAKVCKYCSKDLTHSKSAKGRFWEGGKGCRDVTVLSRKDSRKRKIRK